ncbi:MAG: DUF3160 domain-containing protein [Candidatus Heimdallarchaeota archaeon]|nr:DUF3160 domain-containing protein [Candidatus Heimdallarchaeota archaeon]
MTKFAFNSRRKKIFGLLGGVVCVAIIITCLVLFLPKYPNDSTTPSSGFGIIAGSAANHVITDVVETPFSTYQPQSLSYTPAISPTEIQANLGNVDLQGLTVSLDVQKQLEQYGFALVDEGYEDLYEIYDYYSEKPMFVTTDLCLHSYHVLYDISLRLLEQQFFFQGFETMLLALREDQLAQITIVSSPLIQDALTRNVAYLSVMLYLLNNTNTIPSAVYDLSLAELERINAQEVAPSPIFGYVEDYTQYKVRGHYTKTELLSNYFKSMMYAGRMGFLLEGANGNIEMGINHTRMALLLLSSFDTTINAETVWDHWDRLYQPTAFYVGSSDDLTPREYYQLWQTAGAPAGDALANSTLIEGFIVEAQEYRDPAINSMFVDVADVKVTKGFRLLGQRFIPDSYIFQQLVYPHVNFRFLPNGLDIFSVFGSVQAAYHLYSENEAHPNYSPQIHQLRDQFGNLTDNDWTQNLYWSWLYSLFPLLRNATEGYPGFMLSGAWTDKALMTTMGSWAELRHDTLLYAKQSYGLLSLISPPKGYVEPYPEVYARLGSLVRYMKTGLETRGLIIPHFHEKLTELAAIFDRLVGLSIKELEAEPLTEDDLSFIVHIGDDLAGIVRYYDPSLTLGETEKRTAIIADVHTDPNNGEVLEVATGDPLVIYVVVQDHKGDLRLTRGGTFSYYEFVQPIDNRLSDEEWHQLLDTNPPNMPDWILSLDPLLLPELLVISVEIRKP